ncbi:MAG TPA: hypothetical protein VGZ32_02965 [Actinocrinis sp.]|uniref:hypothetical protein n=1 Tax=Actinocrinis sp. TaxID=1920516 RepID=UPI002DDD185F|nr:hypothetical protein [Actinocrinis sp.]HEV3169266.1 hypothetical protein [Actinocrinis sp.]
MREFLPDSLDLLSALFAGRFGPAQVGAQLFKVLPQLAGLAEPFEPCCELGAAFGELFGLGQVWGDAPACHLVELPLETLQVRLGELGERDLLGSVVSSWSSKAR